MNNRPILYFLIGVIITLFVVFLFKPFKAEIFTEELEGDVRGIYGRLVELGYAERDSEEDIEGIIKEIKEAIEWIPSGTITATATASDVLEGKTFYNKSKDIQTGTYVPEECTYLGDATEDDVLEGKTFYSTTGELLTGTLTVPTVSYNGNASVSDVLAGKTFYSNSGTLKTGTYTPPSVSYLGDALVTEVIFGKKFYSNSGTLLTGTYIPPTPTDFTNMQYSTYEDQSGIDYFGWLGGDKPEDYQGEEAEWTKISDNIWKDERAGLYWSSDQTNTMLAQDPSIPNSNNFTAMSLGTCDYFSSVPRSSYAGTDADCGNAINWCATLTLDGRSNWYLPSQKELALGYIDGMHNQAGDTLQEAAEFTSGAGRGIHYGRYWSSSESSLLSSRAYSYVLYAGSTFYVNKTDTIYGVRCVSRD